MLVSLWWWQISDVGDRMNILAIFSCDGDRFQIVVTEWIYWRFFPHVDDFLMYSIRHQHLKVAIIKFCLQHPLPTSIWPFGTNIEIPICELWTNKFSLVEERMVCLKLILLLNDAGFQTNCHQILMVKIISICFNMGMFSSFFHSQKTVSEIS